MRIPEAPIHPFPAPPPAPRPAARAASQPRPGALGALGALLVAACALPQLDEGQPRASAGTRGSPSWSYVPDLEVSHPPFDAVHVDWKHRLDQPYVYIEHVGSYVETGRLLPLVHRALANQGLLAAGPPFALFYDDPGRTPAAELRSRACIPVERPLEPAPPLSYDLLPSTTVVYAVAGGAYPDVPRCYPGLYAFMQKLRWVEDGPVREIYLVPPSEVADWSELRCEVQIPVTYAER